jgi:hypothetical protein
MPLLISRLSNALSAVHAQRKSWAHNPVGLRLWVSNHAPTRTHARFMAVRTGVRRRNAHGAPTYLDGDLPTGRFKSLKTTCSKSSDVLTYVGRIRPGPNHYALPLSHFTPSMSVVLPFTDYMRYTISCRLQPHKVHHLMKAGISTKYNISLCKP